MQVNGYDTKTLHNGDYKVVVQDGLIVVQMGDEHAIALTMDEARNLAFTLGLEVSKQMKGW